MGRNAKQTQYGLTVSCNQGKRAINALYAPVTETSRPCCNISNCSTLVANGASQNITCGGQQYTIYYNSSSINNATSFCAMQNGVEITGTMPCNCSTFYPSGSYCQLYYGC